MDTVWINGWGRSAQSTLSAVRERWPEHHHEVILPGPTWRQQLEQVNPQGRTLCGYSFGAFLLLNAPDARASFSQVSLFAPFLDLKSETGLGGKVPERSLRAMIAKLKSDAPSLLRSFTLSLGLPPDPLADEIPQDVLAFGLKSMLRESCLRKDAADCELFLGSEDPLVDASSFSVRLPQTTVFQGLGHALAPLLLARK